MGECKRLYYLIAIGNEEHLTPKDVLSSEEENEVINIEKLPGFVRWLTPQDKDEIGTAWHDHVEDSFKSFKQG
jgi:urease accessory protein UreE